jgi:uncharacterized protein (DUF1330 family)
MNASSKKRIYPTGENHPRWKGGKRLVKGYVYVLAKDHPHTTKAGYILEQILVMEAHLGRYLKEGETVHHINGNFTDNRIENLQLFPSPGAHATFHATIEKNIGWVVNNKKRWERS